MSLEEDETSNLHELTIINLNQGVQITIQNSTITTIDISLKKLIEQEVDLSSNIDKLTFCDQLKNLTTTIKHNVNVEQTSRGSSSTTSQKQSPVVNPLVPGIH